MDPVFSLPVQIRKGERLCRILFYSFLTGRWTHHVLISDPSQIDKELMGWIEEASLFSDGKR